MLVKCHTAKPNPKKWNSNKHTRDKFPRMIKIQAENLKILNFKIKFPNLKGPQPWVKGEVDIENGWMEVSTLKCSPCFQTWILTMNCPQMKDKKIKVNPFLISLASPALLCVRRCNFLQVISLWCLKLEKRLTQSINRFEFLSVLM